jgi:hypothetical protein
MVRTAEWTVSRGNDRRDFIAHYADDAPERADAVSFFSDLDTGLYANSPITDDLWAMSVADANDYLAANPIAQTYDSLYLRGRTDRIVDDDLNRLVHLPELIRFHVHSDNITDAGVSKIVSALPNLEWLLVYSPLLTDCCLPPIASLQSLQTLDLQSSPLISDVAFDDLVAKLPNIVDAWRPHR